MAQKRRKKNKRASRSSGPRLSVCLIVRDGADTIRSWTEAARKLGDEVIVVDTGSADDTRTLASVAGARVSSVPWGDDFAAARNYALDRAAGDWIFVLDGDEALARKDRRKIREAIRRPDVDAFRLVTRNYTDRNQSSGWRPCRGEYPDEERRATGWYPTCKVRLFRNRPAFRFRGRVHEMVDASVLEAGGRIENLDAPVHHYGQLSPPDPEKGRFYLRLGEMKVRDEPEDPTAWFELGVQAFALEEFRRAEEALREAADRLERVGPASFHVSGHRPEMVQVMLGAVRERAGDPTGAEEAYRAAMAANADAPEPHLNLGLLLERLGRTEEAHGLIVRAGGLCPDHPQVREALRRIGGDSASSEGPGRLRVRFPGMQPTAGVRPSAGTNTRLSLCMIVRNAAETLGRAIGSVRPIVDEVIVVDTGSTDDTLDVCKTAGVSVHSVPWEENFACARNRAIEFATGDWILALDADEVMAPGDLEKLQRVLDRWDVDGYRMVTRNYTDQEHGSGFTRCAGEYPELERGPVGQAIAGWYPSSKVRLFRRAPEIRFRGRVHESVDESMREAGKRVVDLAVPVHHYGMLDPAVRREKGLRYYRLGLAKVGEMPLDPRAWFELGVQAYEIGELDEADDAFAKALAFSRDAAERVKGSDALIGFRLEMAHVMRGAVASRRGDRRRAAEHHRLALEVNPQAYEAHLNLGILAEEAGDSAEAVERYRRVLELNPGEGVARDGITRLSGTGRAGSGPRRPDGGELRPGISLCMIVRNEAKNLKRCLTSAKSLASEVIVVDTGSTDGTQAVAAESGARVVEIPWREDFAAARNEAIDRATREWVLVMDADEAIAPSDLETLRRATGEKNVAGYRLPSRNYTDLRHGAGFTPCSGEYLDFEKGPDGRQAPGWYPTYKVRLFRRSPAIRFRGRVHEMVDEAILESGGRIADLSVPVHHYGVLDPGLRERKGRRYLQLGEAKVAEAPDDPRAWFELGVQAFETGDRRRSREAFTQTLRVLGTGGKKVARRFRAMGYRPELSHVMLGVLADQSGDSVSAADHYRAALKMNPRAYEAHMNWGILLENQGKLKEAQRHFRSASEVLPGDGRSRKCLERVNRKSAERPEEAQGSEAPNRPAISLCMIVRNEADVLPRCLESVREVVSEIIVVDTGSTDGTRDEARSRGARVEEIPWPEDFAAARNHGLRMATGDWILVLDADEEIAPDDRRNLITLCDGGADAYRLVTRNYVSSGSFSHVRPVEAGDPMARGAGGWFPSTKIRLFRRHPRVRFEGAIHELVDRTIEELEWKIADADLPIHHYGNLRPDEERIRMKRGEYRRLAEKKAKKHDDPKAHYEIGIHAGECGDFNGAVQAFRRTLELAPDFHGRYPSFTNPHALLGANLLKLGRIAEAEAVLEEGRRIVPDNADVLHFLGLARNGLGETETAIETLRSALSVKPDLTPVHRNLGVILRDAGRPEEARVHFERALELDPSLAEVREYLSRGSGGGRLSLCMIVRDEAAQLEDCLRCVRDIVDEMIVVDTGSSDGTAAIAERCGARVFHFPWCDDFAAARNESLRHAAGDYVLWLDADDRLDEDNRAALRVLKETLSPKRDAAYSFILSNRQDGKEMDRCRQLRVFPRREGVAFEGRIHEQVTYALHRLGVPTRETEIRVDHLGYPDLEGLRKKAARNVPLMRLEAQEHPDNWANRFHLACALTLLGDLEEAYRENRWVVEASRCRTESPDWHYNALLHLSRLSQGRGRLEEALGYLEQAGRSKPNDGFLLFSKGELLLAAGRPGEAYDALSKAETRPMGPGAFPLPEAKIRELTVCYKAEAASQLGRIDEAESLYREYLGREPDGREAVLGLAKLHLQGSRFIEAQSLYETLVSRDGGDAVAWSNLGLCLIQQGRRDEAERSFHRALECDPGLVNAWLNLGYLYRDAGKAEPAVLALRKAVELDPRLMGAHLSLADLFVRDGELLEAVRCGLRCLEALGREAPSALEDWQDLLSVFDTLHESLKAQGREADASLAASILEVLSSFQAPDEMNPGDVAGATVGAPPSGSTNAAFSPPEKRGAQPGEKTRIDVI